MKIGIITQWYPPEPEFIVSGLAEELAARGHEVRVLTGFPNYPQGRIYPGYRQRWNSTSTSGHLTVRRVPLYPSHDLSALKRASNYLSFSATSSLAALRYLSGVDAVYANLSPATAAAAPVLLRHLRGIPTVLHILDLWPESVTESPMAPGGSLGRLMNSSLGAAMRRIYRSAASIAATAPTMGDLIVERGADPAKVQVVLNWTDESLFRPVPTTEAARREIGHRGRCTIMHAGNLGPFQNVEGMIRAAAAVEQSGQVDLVMVGSGVEEDRARALAQQLGVDNIRFLGRRPPSEMAALYSAAEYQLVSLLNVPFFRGTIPSKLQAALSCGSPVVVSAPGDSARIVDIGGAGLSCPPGDWRALADRFLQAASLSPAERAEMARRARECYEAQMSKRAGVDQLEKMLSAAVARRPVR